MLLRRLPLLAALALATTGAARPGGGGDSVVPGEILLDCGGGPYTSVAGEDWEVDHGFSTPSTAFAHAFPIAGTDDQDLYRTGRQGSDFTYSLTVPPGIYDITLHFAEHRATSPGRRVFDVACEGEAWIDDLDLVSVAGPRTAYQRTVRRTVGDGVLDLAFHGDVQTATVCAIEVRSPKILILNHGTLDYGLVALGTTSTKNLVLRNRSLHPITIEEVAFENVQGAGHDFSFQLAGVPFVGEEDDVVIPTSITIPSQGTLNAPIAYTPTEHVANEVHVRFSGDFEAPAEVRLLGTGGTGDPYLHAVLLVAPYTVDYDHTWSEPVVLDGSDSHTHEIGHSIVSWTWKKNGVTIGTGPVITPTLAFGVHSVQLSIGDDNQPPRTTSTSKTFRVVAPDAVPGVVVLYYGAPNGDPAALLENLPVNADEAERASGLSVAGERGIGGSSFTSDVMVRMLGKWRVTQAGTRTFILSGGSQSVLYVDGVPVLGPLDLATGLHEVDARFAVDSADEMPLLVQADPGTGTAVAIDPEQLSHDETNLLPVINGMPANGSPDGGYPVSIEGFCFFPRESIEIAWGSTVIPESALTSWAPDRIEFVAPPGQGVHAVRVRNAIGLSDAHPFEYTSTGKAPIAFNLVPPVYLDQPTCAEWGPDGRLYVGTLGGELKAVTFDENYAAIAVQTYGGVSQLVNKNVLGIAFSPWEGTEPVHVYVSHAQLFQNGGGSFQGPSYYSGEISRLTGPAFSSPEPVVTGLPGSNHDHGVNGMTFDANADLLFAVGGNTNAGVKHPMMGDLPESPFSGAIVKARLSRSDFQGAIGYALTSTGQPSTDQVQGELVDVVAGQEHVVLYASGIRNAYDILLSTRDLVYACDNGPNHGYGPASTAIDAEAGDPETGDEVLLVEFGGYYGHPNRNRARWDPRQAVFHPAWEPSIAGVYTSPIANLPSSTDGIAEYRASSFNGAMRGQLLVQKWNDTLRRIELRPDGLSVERVEDIHPRLDALDVVTGPGGAILGIDYSDNRIQPLVPNDSAASGLVVYDITPWRGPAEGGVPFTIGGLGFGTLADTSVTIGGAAATLTSVSPKRITGILPAHVADGGLESVVVSVGVLTRTLTQAFRFLYPPGQALGSWSPAPSMPEALGEVACGVISGKLYLVGEGSPRTLAWDFASQSWTSTLAQRPFPGNHHAAEVYGGRLYLIGGLEGGSEGRVQIYDPVANAWTVGVDLPWAGGSVSTCRIGTQIYASGGIVGATTVDQCAAYDVAANTWSPRASMPLFQGRNHAAGGTDGVRFYVFGGRGVGSGDGNWVANGFDTTQVYDPATDSWSTSLDPASTLVPLPQKRGGMGRAVFQGGEFFVIGGETIDGGGGATANGVYARVDVYNPVTNTWRLDRPMPTARHGICPVPYQGRIHVAGGGVVAAHSSSNVFEIFTRQ